MKFEVGKIYEPYQREYCPILVVKRTEKTIWCKHARNDCANENGWMMRILVGSDGNEYCVDSSAPTNWRGAFTYSAEWIYEEK